jgi:hypothetical protein
MSANTALLALAALLAEQEANVGKPVPIAYPLRVHHNEPGAYLVLDARDREIADVNNASDAGVLEDAYNRAHLAVA